MNMPHSCEGVKPQRGRVRARLLAYFVCTIASSSRSSLRRRMLTISRWSVGRQTVLLEWKPVLLRTLYLSLSSVEYDDREREGRNYGCYKFAVWTAAMTLSDSNGATRGFKGAICLPQSNLRPQEKRSLSVVERQKERSIARKVRENFHQFS